MGIWLKSGVLVAICLIPLFIVPAFAVSETVLISEGSAVPGCEQSNKCYIPFEVNIDVGETITWKNDDTATHTVTSGTAADGPDVNFDSGLFMSGDTFSHTFSEEGQFSYYCTVHPWMTGIVNVGIISSPPEPESEPELKREVTSEMRSKATIYCSDRQDEHRQAQQFGSPYSQYLFNYPECVDEHIKYLQSQPEPESKIASFVDPNKDPQHYVDRYNNEPNYKDWFDKNYPDRTIYEAVGLENPEQTADDVYKMICSSPDGYCMSKVGMNNPEAYGACLERWVPFCRTFDEKQTLDTNSEIICGAGTIENEFGQCIPECPAGNVLIDGRCSTIELPTPEGGGCLIATATYGSELSPQVQMLREIRDNSLLKTQSGQSFMEGFNSFYYSFSPTIADYERQNPVFKETVKLAITPLITSLSILNHVEMHSEEDVLGYGVSLILVNIVMYFVAPTIGILKIKNKI